MRVARSVINSPLVKTAIYGADPNWGRIIAATGKVQDIRIDPEKISVKVGDDYVEFQGAPMIFDKAKAIAHLKQDEVKLLVDLGRGSAAVTVWGCDLSEDYIRINATYTS